MTRLTIADLEIERPNEGLSFEMEDGTEYILQDPKAVHISKMVAWETLPPMERVKAMISEGKWDEFIAHEEVDVYLFEALCTRYAKHYGVGAPGEDVASLRSVKSTARPSKRTSPKRVTA
jgi:hypothetical protein